MMRSEHLLRRSFAQVSVVALCLSVPHLSAQAQTVVSVPTQIGVSEANVLNLLGPFLGLNATTVGQQTLSTNLSTAISINNFAATSPAIAAVSISDKAIFNAASGTYTLPNGTKVSVGPGANLAGGLPVQAAQSTGGIQPSQPIGGLGQLGTAYQTAVSPAGTVTPGVVTLLNSAYNFTSNDLGVAKNYFANGGAQNCPGGFGCPAIPANTIQVYTAIAPTGMTLPTANGYPNTSTSVYDTAYAPNGGYTAVGKNVFGDTRPVQVSSAINVFDPTAISGLTTNPSFPSGHTNYGFTDGLLIGMLVPEFYQSMLLRASEYGNSRIALGVHYPLDIIASRSFAQFDLAQLLNGTNAAYQQTNNFQLGSATNTATNTALNLNQQFQTAANQLNAYLNTQTGSCGGSLAACAASNPYNSYSTATYSFSSNSALYQYRQTYGLPTLSFTDAPREAAPKGFADASILLATVYGGSSTQAQALASSVGGARYGNLASSTINQIIVNTESNALAAFYGSSLSYWSRINLYDAAGYLQNVTGTLSFASGDLVKSNVTVSSQGVLGGPGTIIGNLTFSSGSTFSVQGNGTTTIAPMTATGNATFQSGSQVQLTGTFVPGTTTTNTILSAAGGVTNNGLTLFASPALNAKLLYPDANTVQLKETLNYAASGLSANQTSIGNGLNSAAINGGGGLSPVLTALLSPSLNTTGYQAALNQLSPEIYNQIALGAVFSSQQFSSDMMSCRVGGDDGVAIAREGQCLWVRARARSLDRGGNDVNSNQLSGTFSTGIQLAVAPDWKLGVAGGYETSQITTGTNASSSGDTYQGGAVLKYNPGPLLLAAAVTGGWGTFDTTRQLSFAGFSGTATGSSDVDFVSGRLHASYLFNQGSWYWKPIVEGAATRVDLSGFTERGGNGAGLVVNSAADTFYSVSPALEVGTEFRFDGLSVLRPFLRGGVSFVDNGKFALDAGFASAPAGTNPFRITTNIDTVFADVSAGVDVISTSGITMKMQYDGRYADQTRQSGFSLKASVPF